MQFQQNHNIPLLHYEPAGSYLSGAICCYILFPSEAQKSFSGFHMRTVFPWDFLANCRLGWYTHSPVLTTLCWLLWPLSYTFVLVKSSCSTVTGDHSILMQKYDSKRLKQELETFTILHEKCYLSAELVLFVIHKWEHKSLFLSKEKKSVDILNLLFHNPEVF